ncbi:putative membrane-bound dehydrogenase-like protein [Larkinella arboricola]|uniref:Putative membrane-bound dehydrogenase-like protein n=1 Tax=Larkinella arboricola TaxID=643671 RepID=A0A327WPA4_LARAB|nr:PVC-type heme-binding CxxCH protein [Larkinella arboricola]RAJ93038.1 putative membrane-bound dehydrogenase-like protein [Larkinella arboricola]
MRDRKRQTWCFSSLITVLIIGALGCQKATKQSGISPEEALKTFELEPGFQIELVASEPLVADPVAMEIDEDGRFYVVEMHGYPLDKSGTGKIKLLTDTNGDGRMDESTVFADDLVLPTGIMRWKKGILVTDAPDVLYLEDTDGDGKADVRETILTGFALSNPQHNVNSPLLGLDNWIYLAHESAVTAQVYKDEFGDRGSDILYPKKPDGIRLPDNASGRSVRFRPDRYELEPVSGNTQFGHSFDAWGNRLLVSNANHAYHEVIATPYLKRNPELLVSNVTQSISDHGNAAEVFPITKNAQYQLLTDVGVITSACGITHYLGGAFPAKYDSVTFVAEPVSNLVHFDKITDKGATFTASRMQAHKEFLASTDAWFRPVNMYIGPDGALYVVDYYRQIVEHPEWMAEDVVKSGALYNGTDQGRIYRITPKGTKAATWNKNLLGKATNAQLIEKLGDRNIWWRRHAQRLLLDRATPQDVAALEKMAQNPALPLGRLHALWTLEGLGKLRPELITTALKDPVPGVRTNAIKLAELHLKTAPALVPAMLAMQSDRDPKVRFQLLCTLGFVETSDASTARQKLLFADISDPWVQVAALSAPSSQNSDLLNAVLARFKPDEPAYGSLVERLSAMAGASQPPKTINALLQKATAPISAERQTWQASVIKGIAQGMKRRSASLDSNFQAEQDLLMRAFFDHPSASVRSACLQVLQVTGLPDNAQKTAALQRAVQTAENPKQSPEQRSEAIGFLTLHNPANQVSLLKKLMAPTEPLSVQVAALQALSSIPDETVSQYVLQKWPVMTPDIREPAIATFFAGSETVKPARIKLLLDAVEKGTIDQNSIGWPRSVGLMAYSDKKLRDRARVLLTKRDQQRDEVIRQYQTALDLKADPEKGMLVFQQNCALCHQIGGSGGVAFGPDLATIRNRRPASIMGDILNPNLSIADGYDLWTIKLKNGETVQGLISTETPTALTLRNQGGQETIIARQDIESLKAMNLSAMTAGLEKQINPQQMADLLAYIRKAQ